ncbi:MAG TPA: DUF898 family protein [Thermodesulfobacteriota bacterium]|nr:DUF898 family protein [Thermodesulfobacteriota bacterium]
MSVAVQVAERGVCRPSFHGTGGALFVIHVVNVLLTLATLGVYAFWARVRVRRFFYAQTELAGDRFAYRGTGRELLIGWLKGLVLIGLPIGLLRIVQMLTDSLLVLLAVAGAETALGLVVVPVTIAGAWRYRLSRSEWRGIRFSFRGRLSEAIRVFLGGWLLTVLSFGLYFPAWEVGVRRYLTEGAFFGTRRFGFDGRGADLVPRFALFLLAVLLVSGATAVLAPFSYGMALPAGVLLVAFLWYDYAALRHRYLMGHTTFGAARFRSTVTGRGLFALALVNLLLVALTLGLARPWAEVRRVRYLLDHLALEGEVDLEAVAQEAQGAAATGEGLADFVETAGFGVGLGA